MDHRNRLAQERRKIEENERQARAHVEEAERLKGLGNNLLKVCLVSVVLRFIAGDSRNLR